MSVHRPSKPYPLKPSTRSISAEQSVVREHLAELRGRVRLLTWISGFCWTVVAVFGGLLVAGLLDWLLHFDDSGTRLVVGLGLLAVSCWMVWRQLIAPLRLPLSSTFLATRVERQFPGVKNRIVSAVEFLEHGVDANLGSRELQQAVIGQALDDLQRIEPSDVIETRAVRNVSIAGAIIVAIAATIVFLRPLEAATSVQRLMFPFANVPWPRAVELKLVKADLSSVVQAPDRPLLIARGDALELYVENSRGRLPEKIWFEYRLEGNEDAIREPLRQTTLRDEQGHSHEVAIINWTATRGTMEFRASGGDDHVMPFHKVEVVPPPNINSLQVTATPPEYSQQPVQVLPEGVGHVQGLLGTKVQVTASSDKPLQSAKLRIGEQPPVPLTLLEDERHFSASFEIKDAVTATYWFELTDQQGFTDREAIRYELRGIADSVPEVNIEIPVTDVQLTADAELPVEILAKDDLGLREIRITYQVGDEEILRVIPLYDRGSAPSDDIDEPAPSNALIPIGPLRRQVSHRWRMADFDPEPGMRIVFRAEATDDYDLGQSHVGKSIPRTITIVSRDEKQKELASRVSDLLDDLQQAAELQKRARQQTQELQTQLDKVGELRSQDLDQLQRAELDQRQTASRLSHPADGVQTQAQQLLEEFRANRLSDEGTEHRLERLTNELNRLEREELPDAEQALSRAQKLAEEANRREGKSQRGESNPIRSPAATGGQPNVDDQKKVNPDESSDKQDSAVSQGTPQRVNSQENTKSVAPNQDKSDQSGSEEPTSPNGKADESPSNVSESSTPDTKQAGETAPEEVPSGRNKAEEKSPKGERSAKETPSAERSLRSALAEAQAEQTRSLETLSELQESLSEWRDQRDVSKDLDAVIAEQQKVQQEAAEMAQQTMSKTSAELSPQEKAELNKLAARQRRVAEQLDQFRKQLSKTAESVKKNDADAAEKLNEVEQQLGQQEAASQLQEAAEQIAENQMGAAAEIQKKAMESLQDVERMMKQRPNEDTEQFVNQAQEALEEFQQLREEQQDLADQFQQNNQQPDSPEKAQKQDELMQKQEELEERMAKAERKLERLRLRGAAEAAHRARKRLEEMMKNVQEADDAEEMQEAMDEALDDLEQVERELVLEKRIAQERLAFEQLEKLEQRLKLLRTRQESVIEETVRLDEARQGKDSLTRGQLKSLKDLAETERLLQSEVEQMGQQMTSAEVFSLVLKRLGRSMKLAADGLGERQTGQPVQNLARDAIRKIDSLLAVLQEKKKPDPQQQPGEKPEELANEPRPQEEKPEQAQPPGDMLPQLAQLKLLKSLQEEYLERTEMLETFRDKDGNLPQGMQDEKNELAREQAELADFARNLIAKFLQQQPDRDESGHREMKPKDHQKDDDGTRIDP